LRPSPCGVRRGPAGISGDLLRDERGMLRCLSGKRPGTCAGCGRGSRRGRRHLTTRV
jgi:hypothetical protein